MESLTREIHATMGMIKETKRMILHSDSGFFSLALISHLLKSVLMELPESGKPFIFAELLNKSKAEVRKLYGINVAEVGEPSILELLITDVEPQFKSYGIVNQDGLLYISFSFRTRSTGK